MLSISLPYMAEFYQTFRGELMAILLKVLQKIADEDTLPKSLYEATITLIPKPDKDKNTQKRKLQANITDNYTCKILNTLLANRIQQHIKKLIHHDQAGFIPGM